MLSVERGRYRSRVAVTPADVQAAQRLRFAAFHPGAGAGMDADRFDDRYTHVLIEEIAGGRLVACYRLLRLGPGEIGQSYSAQYYDLGALVAWPGLMVELGRFCLAPGVSDPDVVRLAWAAMTRIVDAEGLGLLFGCTSFAGTEAADHADAFALLRADHVAPDRWRPRIKAAEVVRFGDAPLRVPDRRTAMGRMPPLLRTYLAMGGWVSDHAVIDRQMNTLHVFTGVEVGAIPDARKRLLRAAAG